MFGIPPISGVIFDVKQSKHTGVWGILTLWLADYGLSLTVCCDNDNDNDNENKFIAKGEQQLHWTYISSIKSTLYEAEK